MLTVVEGLELRPNSLFAILPLTPLLWARVCPSKPSPIRASWMGKQILHADAKGQPATTGWCPARLEMARLLDTELVRTLRGGGGEGGGRERSGVTRS